MIKHSEQINELAAALAKAQGVMEGAKKTSNNPYFQSKYADLAECLNTARKPLSDNGIAVSQCVGEIFENVRYEPLTQKVKGVQEYVFDKDGRTVMIPIIDMKVEVTTVLMHSSGQWIASTGKYIVGKQDIQGEGGAVTYARRYGLAAMIGLAQEDDDGNSNVEPPKNPGGRQIKMVRENNDGKTMAEVGKKVDLHSGYGIHINGEAYVRLGGRDIPLSAMNRSQLVKVLEVPEWHEIHKDAQEFIDSIDRIESAMDA